MATETTKIVVETEVKGMGKVQQSLADLKKELKTAQSAALNGDGIAAKRVAELKDKMDDLKDSVKTLQGSGVEKAQSSFRLLGEGFKNFDFDKIKTGFSGIGSALKAIPIFLIAEGISKLIENWDEWGKGNGIVAKSIQFVNGLLDEAKKGLDYVTDALGFTNSALDKFGDTIKTNADKAKDALSEQTNEFDRQIRVAKATGKSTVELEIAKQQAIIDTNVQIAKQIEAFVRAGGELDEEKRKLLTASLDAIKNAKVTEFEIEQSDTKKKSEEYKKRVDEKKKADDDMFQAALDASQKEEDFRVRELEKQKQDEEKLEAERAKLRKQMQDQEFAEQIAQNKLIEDELLNGDKRRADAREAERQAEIESWNNRLQVASNVTNSIANLSEAVFAIRNSQLTKGSEEEEKAAKKQFQIRKALQLAGAIIDGGKAITSSLASAPLAIGVIPNPVGIASLAAAITNSAFSIAKIASTQYQSSATGAGGSSSPPSFSSGSSSASAPNTQAPTTSAQPFTRLDENGNRVGSQPIVKAYVVESEVTDTQKRVGRLQSQSTFG